MKEIWKNIEATNEHYQVSNLGRIKLYGNIINLYKEETGYMRINLWHLQILGTQISSSTFL